MKSHPYFSIVTCTYNSLKHLDECLKSINAQWFENYEHIIIDGNSQDGSWEKLKLYKKNNIHVTVLENRAAHGLIDASNYAISKVKGKYVIFIHADDLLHDNMVLADLEQLLRLKKEPDWIYGQIELINGVSKSLGVFPTHKLLQIGSRNILKFFNYIPHQAVVMKKEVFNKFGCYDMDKSIEWVMDYAYWLMVSDKTRWTYIPRKIAKYRQWEGSNTQSGRLKDIQHIQRQKLQARYQNTFEKYISRIINNIIDNYSYHRRRENG